MLKKTIIAGFAMLIAVFAFQPVEKADAKVRVQIGIGGYPAYYGGGYYAPYYGHGGGYRTYYRPRYYPYYGGYAPRYRYVPRYRARRISCAQGKRIMRARGYRNVRARDCRGRKYRFTGRKRGAWYSIGIRSRNGSIYSIRRI